MVLITLKLFVFLNVLNFTCPILQKKFVFQIFIRFVYFKILASKLFAEIKVPLSISYVSLRFDNQFIRNAIEIETDRSEFKKIDAAKKARSKTFSNKFKKLVTIHSAEAFTAH